MNETKKNKTKFTSDPPPAVAFRSSSDLRFYNPENNKID